MMNQGSDRETAGWQSFYRIGGVAALMAGIAAGLLLMIWHILIGCRLYQLSNGRTA